MPGMRKIILPLVRRTWAAIVWSVTTFTPISLVGATVVTICAVIRAVWEQLTLSQASVVVIGAIGVTLFAIRQGFILYEFLRDWIIYKFRRSFTINLLDPQAEEIANTGGEIGHWYRLSVSCSDQTAEIKSLKCKVGEIIAYGDCDALVIARLDALRRDIDRRGERRKMPSDRQLSHHVLPGEAIEFDLFFTTDSHWEICISGFDVSGSIPLGHYAISIDVFGDESRPAKQWLLVRPDAIGQGHLMLSKAPRGFIPKRPPSAMSLPSFVALCEKAVREITGGNFRLIEPQKDSPSTTTDSLPQPPSQA